MCTNYILTFSRIIAAFLESSGVSFHSRVLFLMIALLCSLVLLWFVVLLWKKTFFLFYGFLLYFLSRHGNLNDFGEWSYQTRLSQLPVLMLKIHRARRMIISRLRKLGNKTELARNHNEMRQTDIIVNEDKNL